MNFYPPQSTHRPYTKSCYLQNKSINDAQHQAEPITWGTAEAANALLRQTQEPHMEHSSHTVRPHGKVQCLGFSLNPKMQQGWGNLLTQSHI